MLLGLKKAQKGRSRIADARSVTRHTFIFFFGEVSDFSLGLNSQCAVVKHYDISYKLPRQKMGQCSFGGSKPVSAAWTIVCFNTSNARLIRSLNCDLHCFPKTLFACLSHGGDARIGYGISGALATLERISSLANLCK